MNASSSRAHTINQIAFQQKFFDEGNNNIRTLVSNIVLIDLAGSERASATGANDGKIKDADKRFKEGVKINQSLTSLMRVIQVLAKKCSDEAAGKKNIDQPPFRDSALTQVLKPYLGGNSKSAMIAALSPAAINYAETLSTLRFADQIKSIKNKADINENPTDKMIRELREEIERLRSGGATGGGGGGSNPAEIKIMHQKQQEMGEGMEKM